MDTSDNNCFNHDNVKRKRGPSSYWMHDPEHVFNALALQPGDRFLDMGCGPGDYSMEASKKVGESGVVYAIDKDRNRIEAFKDELRTKGIKNIKAITADITGTLPVQDNCMDMCLISTVLHIPFITKNMNAIFKEAGRVLKPGKRLAVIECKKEEMPFGPPLDMRLSPDDVEKPAQKCGFIKLDVKDLGYNYMIQFVFKPNG